MVRIVVISGKERSYAKKNFSKCDMFIFNSDEH